MLINHMSVSFRERERERESSVSSDWEIAIVPEKGGTEQDIVCRMVVYRYNIWVRENNACDPLAADE